MKKTNLVSSLVLAGFAVSFLAPVALADVVGTYSDGKATVNFTEGEDIGGPGESVTPPVVPPVGPTDPEPPHGGNTGKLILSVPSELVFGSHAITDTDMNLNPALVSYTSKKAAGDVYKLPPMFVVKDVRGKVDGAWNLSASLSEFKSTDGKKVLAGATLSFLQGQAFNSAIKGEDPSGAQDLLIPASNTDFGINRGGFTFNDQAQMLMSSQNGAGRGETTFIADDRYDVKAIENETYKDVKVDNGIVLNIPATADKEVGVGYQATFTWTIADTMDGQ